LSAVAYIRVSTREQDEDVQKEEILKFAERKGLQIVKWYVDKGESGAKPFKLRPKANFLLKELDLIKPQTILVFAIDRVGRTMLDTVNTILELEKKGIKVVSVKEEWLQTLDSNIRKLILSILSWVAEFERRRIRERQLAAWEMGKPKGRPPVKLPFREILRRLERGWTKKSIWRWLVTDRGIKISYDHFLRRLNKYMKDKKLSEKRVIIKEAKRSCVKV